MKKVVRIPVSFGELLDKITILEIKNSKIRNVVKQKQINKELKSLNLHFAKLLSSCGKHKRIILGSKSKLLKINLRLWKIEDSIRELESKKDFGTKFINLARNVYILNDQRSDIKNKINDLMNSSIREIKQYKKY